MKQQKHIWVIQRKDGNNYYPQNFTYLRRIAREYIDYFNGFSKGTKHAQYRIKKYIEA